jgi:multidrug efflux system outer membrane protein
MAIAAQSGRTMILRDFSTRFARGMSLAVGLLLLPTLRADDSPLRGTMPEDYLPGLKNILQVALKQSPTMITQQINLSVSEAGLLGSDAQLYPQLYGSVGYGVNDESVGQAGQSGYAGQDLTSNSKSVSYSLSLSQQLFTWGAVWKSTRIAKIGLLIEQKSIAEAYRTFVVQLRDMYLGLIMKKINLRNAHFNLKLVEDQLAVQETNLKNGMVAPGYIIGPRLQAEDTRLATDRLDEDYAHSKHLLAQLAGMPSIDEDSIPVELPKVAYPSQLADDVLASILRDNARSLPQAQTYEMYVRQQQLSYEIAKVRQLPKFAAGASYGLSNSTSISLNAAAPGQAPTPAAIAQDAITSRSFNVSASWDIFDGFATRAAIRGARQSKRLYERQLQTFLETTLETVQDYRHQVDFSARALALAERRYDLQQAALNQTTESFRLGTVAQTAVDADTNALYVSALGLASARFDFLSHWSAFISLAGADPALEALPVQYVRPIP